MRVYILSLIVLMWSSGAWAAEYEIDPLHSSINFKVKHLGLVYVPGTFNEYTGKIHFNPQNVASASALAVIAAKSVDTNVPARDEHLRKPDFFDAANFEQIVFKSRKVIPGSGKGFKVEGDLTMHGITKPVELDVVHAGSLKDPQGQERIGFEAAAVLNRLDFGIGNDQALEDGTPTLGIEVQIAIHIEAIRK